MNCKEKYKIIYNSDPEAVAFCPYRISPLGAHLDHQLGAVHGFAIDMGIHIAYSTNKTSICEVSSLNYPGTIQFDASAVDEKKSGDWADHLRAAAKMLADKYDIRQGVNAVIEGSFPTGGLSSSASVIIGFMTVLAKVNGIRLEPWESIFLAKDAENKYVGVNCGKLDQACEVLCRKDQLLYLDCKDDSYQLISPHKSMKPFRIAVFFSGLERSLANSAYNLRQDETKAGALSLLAYAGKDYGTFQETVFRDVPKEVYEEYRDRLPNPFRLRADHYFSEMDRVQRGLEYWKAGDIEKYGQLIFESGRSAIDNYQCGCPEMIDLYEILSDTSGIYGGCFSGAGFKGSCMALIDPEKEEEILTIVKDRYLSIYPHLKDKYTATICDSADGVDLN